MSTNVTNEVVRMTFESGDFERRISNSLSVLQKLKEHLSFKKVSSEVSENTSRMTDALEIMAHKAESIWDRVTDSIRDSIKNKILGALNEVKDMTVNQLTKGWEKYAEKTDAVATLVGQGYDMKTVNEQMEKLNRYTDETSYQFTNMVQNIGKFTAAGQSLEDANLAMQGIANWAAKSGTNATKASQAMYQLSQAMGKGALKLDDYKSVQNLGMDTMEFKQQAVEAAVALGTLRDNFDGTYTVINESGQAIDDMTFNLNSFTTQLTEGQWLTSDVMMKTFSRYASAIDNINYMIEEEGVNLASDAIKELEKRNTELREEFRTLEGTINMSEEDVEKALLKWSKVTEVTEKAVKNYMEYNKDVTEEQARAALNQQYEDSILEFSETFGVSSKKAKEFIHDFNGYTDQFGLDAYKMAQEAKTFRDAIDSVKDAASTQWMNVWEKIFGDYAEARVIWTKFANFLYDVLVDWLNGINKSLDKWVEKGGRTILLEAFTAIGDIIWVIRDAITDINKALFGKTNSKKLLKITERFRDTVFKIRDFFVELQESDFLENLTATITGIRRTIKRAFSAIKGAFEDTFGTGEKLGTRIVKIFSGLTRFGEKLRKSLALTKENTQDLRDFLGGMLSMTKLIVKVFGGFIGTLLKELFPGAGKFFDKIKGFKDDFLGFMGDIGRKLKEVSDTAEDSNFFQKVSDAAVKAAEVLRTRVYPIFKTVFGGVYKIAEKLYEMMKKLVLAIVDLVNGIPWDKVKESLKGFKDKLAPLKKVATTAKDAIKDFVKETIKSMSEFDEDDERNVFQKAIDALAAGLRAFKDRIKESWAAFKEVVGEVTQSKAWQKLTSFLTTVWITIKGIFMNYVKPVLEYIWSLISGPVNEILNMIREGRIKDVLELIKDIFKIKVLAGAGSFLTSLIQFFKDARLAQIISSIAGVFNSMSLMFTSLAGTADYAKQAVKAWKNEKMASALLKIVIALGLIVGIVFALSFVSPERMQKMMESMKIVLLAAVVVVAMLVAVAVAAHSGSAKLLSLAGVFISIGLAVAIIVQTIKFLGKELQSNTSDILLGFVGVITILALVVTSVYILIKQANKISRGFADTRLLGIAAIFAALGVAIGIMALTMKKMGEMDAADFWQAMAGVILMIATLSAATWLLNVQKSQKGTLALIGLVLVVRYMLLPMLRSIAKEKFDLGQALLAVFIPLLLLCGYLFAITKIANSEGGTKGIILAIVALVVILASISNKLIPALAKASQANTEGLIAAGAAIMIVLLSLVATVALLSRLSWTDLLKGAVGVVAGILAITLILDTMSEAFNRTGKNGSDFITMGLGIAIVLIALAGAMALIGSFAGAAITGASAILILAIAISLLTQAIIAFKKYVLGENIGDMVGDATNVNVVKSGAIEPSTLSKKQVVKNATETSELNGGTIQKRAREAAGAEAAVDYSKGFTKGMDSSKAKEIQNEGAETLVENTGDGLNTMKNKDLLDQYGIDTTELYADGMGSYDANNLLEKAGLGSIDTLSEGMSGADAAKILEDAGITNVDSLMNGMTSDDAEQIITDGTTGEGGIESLLTGGTGIGGIDLSGSGSDLTGNLLNGMVSGDGVTSAITGMATGEGGLESLLTGAKGIGGIDLTGSGNSLLSSLLGGMTSTELIVKAAGGIAKLIVEGIDSALSMLITLGSYWWETFFEPNGNQAIQGSAIKLTTPEENKRLQEEAEAIQKIAEERGVSVEKAQEEYILQKAINGYVKENGEISKVNSSNMKLMYNGKIYEPSTPMASPSLDLKDYEKEGKKDGNAIVEGMEESLKTGMPDAAETGFVAFSDAWTSDQRFGIHSPSTWAEKIAKFIAEGLGIGLINNLVFVDNALELMQDRVFNSCSRMVAGVQALLNQSEVELVITPVIDFDSMQYQIGGMRFDANGAQIGSKSFNLSKDVGSLNGTRGESNPNGGAINTMNSTLKDILGAVSKPTSSSGTLIEIHNEVGVETVIKKVNRKETMIGKSVWKY